MNNEIYLLKKRIEREKNVIIRVTGNSMAPIYIDGDDVIVSAYNTDCEVGDVVFFYTENITGEINYVVHRINRIGGKKIWTKGDNNPDEDREYIEHHNVLGIVKHKKLKG